MSLTAKVVFATINTSTLTLYTATGDTITVNQGDPRLPGIVETLKANPPSKENPTEVSLEAVAVNTIFDQLGLSSEQGIKFLRLAKGLLDQIFETPQAAISGEQHFGDNNVVDTIMKNAVPVGQYMNKPSTIVAVTKENTVISGIEKIHSQVEHAVNTNDSVGITNFLMRVASVASTRRHSAEDLLTFLQKADMPIADNGDIIGYKRLYSKDDHFVDSHTKKVEQKPGDLVFVNEKLVDPDRRKDCSNGLHIASRSYIGNFSGDTVFLVRIRPEDCIAVPEYDTTKMRVSAYHVLMALPKDLATLVMCNSPLTDKEEGKTLLANVLAGNHLPIIRHVEITAHNGDGLKISEVKETKPGEVKEPKKMTAVVSLKESNLNVDDMAKGEKVSVESVKATTTNIPNSSVMAEKVRAFFKAKSRVKQKEAAQAVVDFKRKTKKSWEILGVTVTEYTSILEALK